MTRAGEPGANEAVIDLASPRQWNAVRSPVRLGLLEVITSTGGATARELADVLGMPPSLVHYHLGILERGGLVKAGRREGKGGRTHSTVGRRLVVIYDSTSKIQAERARQLVASRLGHSIKVIESHVGDGRARMLAHWEALTKDEHKEIVKHFDQVDRILARARRRRRRQDLASQRATSHVLFAVEHVDGEMPPSPRIDLRPRS